MERLKSFYKNKNVLVTGGAGFIGSHLSENLCSHESNVTILDDLSFGCVSNLKNCSVNFMAGNITDFEICLKATKDKEIVFHLAAMTSVPESVKNPLECEKINVEGTTNLLEACKENNVQTFIFSSSAAIYGNRNDECKETDTPNPKSPYAKSKLKCEDLCRDYAYEYDMSTASLRYFNVYGKRQRSDSPYSGVVAKFTENLMRRKPILIYGNGQQKRDFVHVSKVVEANTLIGSLENLKGEVFNVATGMSITLFELLQNLEFETKQKKFKITLKSSRPGDIFNSQANCEKYDKLIRTFRY